MMKLLASLWLLLLASSVGCGDSRSPTADGGRRDGTVQKDGAPKGDLPKPTDDQGTLPWPDLPAYYDTTPWNCTPGAAGMCDDNKFHYCNTGKCAKCPSNYVDCDRQGDCECFGACNGTKCVGSK